MKKYNVIYADPPWSYNSNGTPAASRPCLKRGDKPHTVNHYYDTMSMEDIMSFPLTSISEKDAVLFLWVTNPLLQEGLETMKLWGFEYKTIITWYKINGKGMGYWFRGYTEHLLLGVKGKVKAFRQQAKNFYESEEFELDECYKSKTGKHSEKPPYFRELINEAVKVSFEEPKKLELFARSRKGLFPDAEYAGWYVYGNEINNSITI